MQTILIIVIMGLLFLMILMNKIKLNFFTIFLITIIGVSLLNIVNQNKTHLSYVKMETSDDISEIWANYSDLKLTNDVQLSRTLNPYKVQSDVLKEPNQVVSDENRIYSISENKVVVTNTSGLAIIHQFQYVGQVFRPMLLYVTDNKIIVIGEVGMKTRCYIYNKQDFSEFKNFEVDATYITSRLIHDELYLVSSKFIENQNQTHYRPNYVEGGMTKTLPYKSIYYVKHTYPNNFVNILKTNINKKDDIHMMSYLGLGQVVYFAPKHIYIAEEEYAKETGNSNKTILIKIENDTLKVSHLQEVPGYVLDQYSLDEYNGYLRVATSSDDDNHLRDSNNIYILDDTLKIVGKLENFSVGNEIQAAAFIKNKAYVETFNILDPFYVIDLSNPRKPKIISELKFAGYNTNFIPYDENHILAFGLILNDDKQSIGLKVSLYDVTNPKTVKIVAKDSIMYSEYNSAYSDVLYDCKSLLLDKKDHILGFPIIYWINEKGSPKSYYKQFYAVYKISDNGLKKLGKVSHYEKGKHNNVNDDIKRGLIINHDIFTVSDKLIMENDLPDLKLKDEVYL